jgi:hypothetical protein
MHSFESRQNIFGKDTSSITLFIILTVMYLRNCSLVVRWVKSKLANLLFLQ